MKKVFLLFFLCYQTLSASAGGFNETSGARAVGLGGASVTLVDGWSGSNNPGSLGLINQYHLAVAYESRFFLPEAAYKALSFVSPLGGGTIGIIGHSFGYAAFNNNRVGLAYSRKLSDYLSLGVQINYVQVNIGDVYGSRSTVSSEIGLLITPNENVSFGVHLVNPTRARLADFDEERIPTELKLGAKYTFSEKVSLMTQVNKDLDLPIDFNLGIEYEPVEHFFMRTGFSTLRKSFALGIGYKWKGVVVDVSNQWNQQLGFGAAASLAYSFGQRKK